MTGIGVLAGNVLALAVRVLSVVALLAVGFGMGAVWIVSRSQPW